VRNFVGGLVVGSGLGFLFCALLVAMDENLSGAWAAVLVRDRRATLDDLDDDDPRGN
jgi:hypothetical protein